MAVRPIIFSSPMVKALLDGRKIQSRRIIKPQPHWIEASGRWCWPLPKHACFKGCCTEVVTASREWHEYAPKEAWPYGLGDLLWMRETWAHVNATGSDARPNDVPQTTLYRATCHGAGLYRWRPSIHMPRWASRLTLEVTDVRVQRLQEISEADALAEGMTFPDGMRWGRNPREAFSVLWDTIHGAGAWARNEWVVALTFHVHRCNVDQMACEAA